MNGPTSMSCRKKGGMLTSQPVSTTRPYDLEALKVNRYRRSNMGRNRNTSFSIHQVKRKKVLKLHYEQRCCSILVFDAVFLLFHPRMWQETVNLMDRLVEWKLPGASPVFRATLRVKILVNFTSKKATFAC